MHTQKLSITKTEDGRLVVRAPYNQDFVIDCHRLNGKFSNGCWTFDSRDEQRVRAVCFEHYGQDGFREDLCTVEVRFDPGEQALKEPITVAGRSVAFAKGRDSGASLADGVILLKGNFTSGGSSANWTTVTPKGALVLIRDFPRPVAQSFIDNTKQDETPWLRIVDEAMDQERLKEEKERLLKRLEELEVLMGQPVEGSA